MRGGPALRTMQALAAEFFGYAKNALLRRRRRLQFGHFQCFITLRIVDRLGGSGLLRRRRRRTEPGVERERNPRKIDNNGSRSHKALLRRAYCEKHPLARVGGAEGAAVVRLKEFALTTRPKNPAVALLSSFSTRFSAP